MGTDMHVAIEVKRKEWDYKTRSVCDKWTFVRYWTVDRSYSLFGCFGNYRCMWSNSFCLDSASDMSYNMNDMKRKGYYGFHVITPDFLTSDILGWKPPKEEWQEEYEGEGAPPAIDKEWFFNTALYIGDDTYADDYLNYYIYKLMLRKYGKKNVRLIVFFDS